MIPSLPSTLVERQGILRRLNPGRETRLVLVSAPAGSGKTTLLAEWLRRQEGVAAWVLLEAADNDLERFLLYLLAALRGVDPALDRGLSAQLRVQGAPEVEPFLTRVLNGLSQGQVPLTLVLDDYHVIRDVRVHAATEFLLEHLPPGVRLALGTRSDPPFALRRLRARGQLLEVRADTLRFARPDVQVLLNERYGLELSPELVERLGIQTEGWIAGLQLAALSLADRSGDRAKEAFVAGFSGRHRHLADYLFSEVLEQQPPDLVLFLQRTAVLDRLTLPLCAAVVGKPVEPQRLRELETRNLFLLPLDDEGRWYRYHPLFAEFLRQRLQETEPDVQRELYQRASRWCETNSSLDEAVAYAFRADDPQQAARLIESVAFTLGVYWDNVQLIRYAQKVPLDVLVTFPRLCIYYAWALTNTGQLNVLAQITPLLEASEKYTAEPHTVRACLLTMQAYERLRALDAAASAALCEAALAELGTHSEFSSQSPSNEERWLLVAATNLMAYGLSLTHPERAETLYPEAIELSNKYGNLVGVLNGFARLGRVQQQLGKLEEAEDTLERGLREQKRAAVGTGEVVNTGEVQVNLALLLYEQDRLEESEVQLERARELNLLSRFPPVRVLELKAAVLLALARKDSSKTETLLEELGKLGETISPENLLHRHIFETTSMELRLLLAAALDPAADQQRASLLDGVRRWTEMQGLREETWGTEVEAVFGREARYALLASLNVQQNRKPEALALLTRLTGRAQDRGHVSDLIRYLVLTALAHTDRKSALRSLERAVQLAEGAGYRRALLDGGSALHDLLSVLEQSRPSLYLTSLLTSYPSAPKAVTRASPELSDRQRDVLRLLSEGRSNKEIAKALGLSPNTVKWYLRDIYAVLGVRSRGKAVMVARANGFA